MRPLELKITGLGPYAGSVEIPMRELGSQGLYLITGDTGAGKTTIFDAICFALYGEASGEFRDPSMFRSKYAAPETPTEVELTFLHYGKEYKVKRNPGYMRPSKKGEGETKQVADATLWMPDGKVIAKTKEVTAAIEEILGINRDQFSQIAMIAQGDFLKLLLASTSDRRTIFSKLFHTRNYEVLQDKLDEEKKKVSEKVKEGRTSIRHLIEGIRTEQDDVLSLEAEKAKNGELTVEDVLELLEKLILQDQEKDAGLKGKIAEVKKELETVNAAIGAAEALETARNELENAKKKILEEEPKLEPLTEERDKAKAGLNEKEELKEQATRIEAKLPDYRRAEELKNEILSLKKNQEKRQKEWETLSRTFEEDKKKTESLKKELETLQDTEAKQERLNSEINAANEEDKKLERLLKDLTGYEEDVRNLNEKQEYYNEKRNIYDQMNQSFERMDQLFRDGQAGVLAEKLEEGIPCPVCGSVHHPDPAKRLEEVPSEEQWKKAKEKAESARDKRDQAAEAAGRAKAALETKKEALTEKLKERQLSIREEDASSVQKIKEELNAAKKENLEKKRNLDNNAELLKKDAERREEIRKEIPKLEEKKQQTESQLNALRDSMKSDEGTLQEKEQQEKDLRKTLTFEGEEQAAKKRDELLNAAEQLQETYDKAEEALRKQKETVDGLRIKAGELQKTIEGSKAGDVTAEREKKKELDRTESQYQEEAKTLSARIGTNQGIRKGISEKEKEISEIERRLQWVAALADTANGRLTGKDKILLETYIQMTYFDRVIRRANLRLMVMSSGQYELERLKEAADGRQSSGLDLEVVDHTNGSRRNVKTLSGGESFMASLSLALGLADEVQAAAGGIHIDTMFVDEGFGSLDPDTLDQAYKALAGLSEGNKLVGIISHVSDLKNKIEKQIVVTKEKNTGSHVNLVI